MIDPDDTNTYLTTKDLAIRYDLKPGSIKRWRSRGHGPAFYRVNHLGFSRETPRVRYKLADVLAWELSNNITPIN